MEKAARLTDCKVKTQLWLISKMGSCSAQLRRDRWVKTSISDHVIAAQWLGLRSLTLQNTCYVIAGLASNLEVVHTVVIRSYPRKLSRFSLDHQKSTHIREHQVSKHIANARKEIDYWWASGKPVQCFYCGNCTSHIYHHQAVMPNKIIIRTLLLNGGPEMPATGEIFGEGRLSWVRELQENLTNGANGTNGTKKHS